ncbi:MAG: EamA family transporter [Bacteroidota bacterium]
MTNILFLTLAGLLIGVVQIINKRLVSSNHRSTTYTSVTMLANAVVAFPLLFINFRISYSLYYWGAILLSVLLFTVSCYYGFKAYKEIDISAMSVIQRLNIVFVALIGLTFLRENYSVNNYVGFCLILAGGLVVVYEKRKLLINKGVIYALIATFFGAVSATLDKVILKDFSPFTYAFLSSFLVGITFLWRKDIVHDNIKLFQRHKILIILRSILGISSYILLLLVLAKTNVSQTMPVYKGLSLIIPVILGILVLGEKTNIKQKIAGTLMSLLGIMLMY